MAELVESYLMTFMNFILLFLIAMVNTEDAQCMTNINIGISSAQLRYKFLSNKFPTLDVCHLNIFLKIGMKNFQLPSKLPTKQLAVFRNNFN